MPSSRRTQYDDYIEPPRQRSRTNRETRTSSSRSGGIFGEEVRRRSPQVPSSPLPRASPLRSTFSSTIHICFDNDGVTRQSSRRYATETRVPSSPSSRTHSRTTESYTEREGGRTRTTYFTEERVPSSRSTRQQSSRTSRYAEPEPFRYAEPEPYRYDDPEPYSYAEFDYSRAEPDSYHFTEPEPEPRRRRATYGPSSGRSHQTYYTEERQPSDHYYDSPPSYTSSRPRYSHTSSSSSSSSTPRTPRSPPSYSSSRSSGSSQRPEPMGVKPRNNLYAVLKLSRDATSAEVKKAYRTLSLCWHPDRCSDEDRDLATEKMAEINQANDVLGDSGKRAYYDRYGLLPAGM